MKKEDIKRANYLVKMIDKSENLLNHINNTEVVDGSKFTLKFDNGMDYRFNDTTNYRMFYNILKSSVELDLERYNKELDEI